MTTRLAGLLAALPLALAIAGCRRSSPDLTGEWAGAFNLSGAWSALRAHLKTDGATTRGTVDMPFEYAAGLPVEVEAGDDGRLRFAVTLKDSVLTFDGRLARGAVSGEVQGADRKGRFELTRLAAVDPRTLAAWSGDYALGPGTVIHVQTWDELGPQQLAYFDQEGNIRALYPTSETTFFAGPAMMVPGPAEERLTFVRGPDGRARRLERERGGAVQVAARDEAVVSEEVVFEHDGLRLAGTLLTPRRAGRHPALVVLHGSGPQDRLGSLPFVWFLVREGLALLVFDKRGVGGSAGDWRRASFQDLAADAMAAVEYLKGRPEIDQRRIGVFGVSQGGWIGPLAASRSRDIAFVVSVSGPGVGPAEETLDFTEHELRALGFPDEDIRQALALTRLGQDFARTGEGYERLEEAARLARDKPWFFPDLAPPRDHFMWDLWRLIVDYDPAPALSRVACPVLAMFGGLDRNVLPEKNSERWARALKAGGNQDASILILPRGNHALLEATDGTMAEFPRLGRFLPDYRRTLVEWLRRHGLLAG